MDEISELLGASSSIEKPTARITTRSKQDEMRETDCVASGFQASGQTPTAQPTQHKHHHTNTQAAEKDDQLSLAAAKSMAAVTAKLIKATQMRPLRQINVVGQLNHSARQGFLSIMANPIVALFACLMLISILMSSASSLGEASVWPFGIHNTSIKARLWPSTSGSSSGNSTSAKRMARTSGDQPNLQASLMQLQQQQQQQQPVGSQQFHYFWNHDQIEPKTVAIEASKILADAQGQTDRNLLTGGAGATAAAVQPTKPNSRSSGEKDPDKETMLTSGSSPAAEYQQEPIVIPASIQQQLTALVLQMQRQQQMSMMMQPRFEHSPPSQAASRRVSVSPFAGGASGPSPFWMADQSPAASLARSSVAAPPTAATIAGVPVFGPFLVAPSPFGQAASRAAFFQQHQPALISHHLGGMRHHQSLVPAPAAARSAQVGSSPTRSRSFLSQTAKKSWPFFGSFHSSSGGNQNDQRGGLFAAASLARPTIVAPPSSSQSGLAGGRPPPIGDLALLPPESMALLDMASSQLVNAIAGQMQVRAAQQKLAAVLSQAMDNPDFMQVAASSLSEKLSPPIVPAPASAKTANLLAPYLMSPAGYPVSASANPAAAAAARAMATMNLATANSIPVMQTLELLSSVLASPGNATSSLANQLQQHQYLASDVPFGNRLKRRHLNTVAPSTGHKSPRPPTKQQHQNITSSETSKERPTKTTTSQRKQIVSSGAGLSAPSAERRIVKKDSAAAEMSRLRPAEKQLTEADHSEKSSSEQLLAADSSHHQVRRIKRSALMYTSSDSVSSQQAAGWRSMDSQATAKTTSRELLRRQAEVSSPAATPNISSLKPSDQAASSSSSGGEPSKTSGERQEKSLKIKRVIASASVLHHPVSSAAHKSAASQQLRAEPFKRGTIISGTPTILNNNIQQTEQSSAAGRQQLDELLAAVPAPATTTNSMKEAALDPMISAMSESTRVANYFQNVDREKSPAQSSASAPHIDQTSRQPLQPAASVSSSVASQAPKINLAFSAPSKLTKQENSDDAPETDRISSGNGGLASAPSAVAAPAGGRGSGQKFAATLQRQQNQRHLARSQSSAAGVGSADISSAATGHNLQQATYAANAGSSSGPSTSTSFMSKPASQQSAQSGQIAGQSATNAANYARSSQAAQLSDLVGSLMSGLHEPSLANSKQHSIGRGLKDQAFGATSFNRHSVVAPNSKQQSSASASFERNTSADQSNSYNDEMLPPSQMQQSSYQHEQQQMMNSAEAASQQLVDSQQQRQQFNSMDQSQSPEEPTVDPISGQSMMGLSGDGYGQRNNQQQQQQQDNGMLQDLVQQQQQQSAEQQQQLNNFNNQMAATAGSQSNDGIFGANSNQSADGGFLPAAEVTADTSSGLYGANQLQQQQPRFNPRQFQQQLAQQSDNLQYLAAPTGNSNQLTASTMMPQQQQLYSQQMQALGAAVSNFNQQRLNQQLQAANYNPNTRTFFGHQQHQQQQQQQQQMNQFHQSPNYSPIGGGASGGQFGRQTTSIDEDAAAGTLAAQGIATMPNVAQLMAMQNHPHTMGDLTSASLLMAGSEKREQAGSDDDRPMEKKKNKKRQHGGPKQVSHHYHFNSLGSPFEDPNNEFGGVNPLDIAGSLQGHANGYVGRPIRENKVKVKDEEEKNEEEKPKKKSGFLRRFSLKNLFKRFRKDKKKENEEAQEEDDRKVNNNENENSSADNNDESSPDRG